MERPPKLAVTILLILALVPAVSATQLGVNYYHESLVSERWGVPYINVDINQVQQDFQHISEISSHLKFYMNPFVDKNLPWIKQISQEAKNQGFHIVVNMMTDDRNLDDGNWGTYRAKVLQACSDLNGKVDSILVGNEISLHSPWDKYVTRQKVEPLINDCKNRFSGEVTYEAFWYEKEAWYNYQGKLYWMQYENLNSFTTNVQEMQSRFGSNAYIGEWGEDSLDENTAKDDWWQREEIIKRWNVISQTDAPIAYIFAYREPNWNAFGIINPAGGERPVWSFLETIGSGGGSNPPPDDPPPNNDPPSNGGTNIADLTPICTHNNKDCSPRSDVKSGVCRTITWRTDSGDIKVQGCEKSDGYVELYRQTSPSGTWTACLNNGCVDNKHGFARFIPVADDPTPDPDPQPDPDPTPTTYDGIEDLPLSCDHNNQNCNKQSDQTSGVCRTVTWSTSGGTLKVQGCEKSDGYVELYRQSSPSGDYEACFANGCVSDGQGFARFMPEGTTAPPPDDPPPSNDPPPDDPPSTYDGSIQSLSTSCDQNNQNCNKKTDTTSGTCRTVTWGTNYGNLQVKACKKSDGYVELYKQSNPGGDYRACFDIGCVSDGQGFARFKP